MFDVGFSELVVIGVIALLVFGPEDLPRVARTVGHLLGKLQRYVADVKSEINREMENADLKRLQTEVQESVQSIQSAVNEQAKALENEFQQVSSSIQQDLVPVTENTASSEPFSLESPPGDRDSTAMNSEVVEAEADQNQLDLFATVAVAPDSEKKG